MRPVFVAQAGLWCAAGTSADSVRRGLLAPGLPGRLSLLQDTLPYAFATDPARPFQVRLDEALAAVGASLDLATLPASAPLFLGSSSLLTGAAEELAWPPPPGFAMPMEGLLQAVRGSWELRNPGWTFSCGCTSGVHALDAAIGLLESGAAEEALVVGVEVLNRTTVAGFASLQLLAPETARPLDANRNGMMLGEAVAAVRLSIQPGPWRVHAPALALDVTSTTGHAEDGSTIAATMERALAFAGVAPGEVQAVKLQAAGGLGTDALEARALRSTFGEALPAQVSLKAALGHTLGACGLVEMVALLYCGEAGWLPPTAGFSRMDPELAVTPLEVARSWTHGPILLNVQGFGGGLASWVVGRP